MTGQFSVDFAAPAELRKWPSLNNQRRPDRETYVVTAGPLECVTGDGIDHLTTAAKSNNPAPTGARRIAEP